MDFFFLHLQTLLGSRDYFNVKKSSIFDSLIRDPPPSATDSEARSKMIEGANSSKFFQLIKSIPGFQSRASMSVPNANNLRRRRSSEKKRKSLESSKTPRESKVPTAPSATHSDCEIQKVVPAPAVPMIKEEDLRFSFSKSIVDRKIDRTSGAEIVKTVTIVFDHYPVLAHWRYRGTKKNDWVLHPVLRPPRPLSLIFYNCSSDVLDTMMMGEEVGSRDFNLVRIDSACKMDSGETYKFLSKVAKVNSKKMFNCVVAPPLNLFPDFVDMAKQSRMANVSSSYGLVMKLLDNPSSGTVIHKEVVRNDTILVAAIHLDYRPVIGNKQNPKATDIHFPGASCGLASTLKKVDFDFTSSLIETFDMNSKAYFMVSDPALVEEVKQHQRSAAFNSDLVCKSSFFFF